jgi:uncharacterized Zn finger protein
MCPVMLVSEELILTKATDKSFQRGRGYYDSGMVESVVQRGSRLFAEVLGNEEDLYHVGVTFQDEDFSAFCTCPYDWGGYCKHIVATLLTFVHDRELVTVRAPVEQLLSNLGADDLKALILRMVESEPQLAETIDEMCQENLTAA